MQGDQSSDSVLGVGTPVRFSATGGVFYYNNLTSIEPQSLISDDLELGLTRRYSVRARVNVSFDLPIADPSNVPLNSDSLYGELHRIVCKNLHILILMFVIFVTRFHSRSWSFQ